MVLRAITWNVAPYKMQAKAESAQSAKLALLGHSDLVEFSGPRARKAVRADPVREDDTNANAWVLLAGLHH
jgi:hypothetical protein